MKRKSDMKLMRAALVENLTGQIHTLIALRAVAEFGTLTQLKSKINNPFSELQKFLRWTVVPSGILDELKLNSLVRKDRKQK